jgi:hypothetical protein
MRTSFFGAVTTAIVGLASIGKATAQVTVTQTRTYVKVGTGGYSGPGFTSPVPPGANVVIIGKVIEVEPDAIEVVPFRGAPKERMLKYKVANIQIEDRILGAGGTTRIRVGFPADGRPTFAMTVAATGTAGGPPPRVSLDLPTGTEACFALAKHPNADFYVLTGPATYKKDPSFAKEVDKLKKYGKAISDPVAALKAKDLKDRFEAAQIILQRYLIPQGSNQREPIPEEENKLILALLSELPWLPPDGKRVGPDGRLVPRRSAIWFSINPNELGFKRPPIPKAVVGDPPLDFEKVMDQATSEFLKEKADKIRIKRFVQK